MWNKCSLPEVIQMLELNYFVYIMVDMNSYSESVLTDELITSSGEIPIPKILVID